MYVWIVLIFTLIRKHFKAALSTPAVTHNKSKSELFPFPLKAISWRSERLLSSRVKAKMQSSAAILWRRSAGWDLEIAQHWKRSSLPHCESALRLHGWSCGWLKDEPSPSAFQIQTGAMGQKTKSRLTLKFVPAIKRTCTESSPLIFQNEHQKSLSVFSSLLSRHVVRKTAADEGRIHPLTSEKRRNKFYYWGSTLGSRRESWKPPIVTACMYLLSLLVGIRIQGRPFASLAHKPNYIWLFHERISKSISRTWNKCDPSKCRNGINTVSVKRTRLWIAPPLTIRERKRAPKAANWEFEKDIWIKNYHLCRSSAIYFIHFSIMTPFYLHLFSPNTECFNLWLRNPNWILTWWLNRHRI